MISLVKLYEETKQSQYKIYCDMDGVLADFDLQFKNLTGLFPKQYEQKYGIDKFWDIIPNDTTRFWSQIPWMKDGKQLWDYIRKYNPTILSAPSREQTSKQGKREWVMRELPNTNLKLKGAQYKHEFAKPNHILIDDRADTIKRWNDAGGIGILHISSSNTIKQLKKLGL